MQEAVLLHKCLQLFKSGTAQLSCPELSTLYTYRADGEKMLSQETTQGDPLAMPMYALATIPLIDQLPRDVTQIWYVRSLTDLRAWWEELSTHGMANAAKTWLVTKENVRSEVLEGTAVISHGTPLGSQSFVLYMKRWKAELLQLCYLTHTAGAVFPDKDGTKHLRRD